MTTTFSAAMLRGFERVEGNQVRGHYVDGGWNNPTGCCVMAAVSLGSGGDVRDRDYRWEFANAFRKAWGVFPADLNDNGMPWEHIYGMTVAAGL
jgi:hypothetical protein